jgi:hypothetical protein
MIWRVPVDIDPDAAREAAARELADPVYQQAEPSIVEQMFAWLGARLVDLLTVATSSASGGLLVLVILGVVVFAVVRWRVGRLTRSRPTSRAVFPAGRRRDAGEYREAAEQARAQGDLAGAVRERFRAIVRELEDRGILDERSGRTVDEIAVRAAEALPAQAGELAASAGLFDDVVYGGHPATEAGYHRLAALDTELQAVVTR